MNGTGVFCCSTAGSAGLHAVATHEAETRPLALDGDGTTAAQHGGEPVHSFLTVNASAKATAVRETGCTCGLCDSVLGFSIEFYAFQGPCAGWLTASTSVMTPGSMRVA